MANTVKNRRMPIGIYRCKKLLQERSVRMKKIFSVFALGSLIVCSRYPATVVADKLRAPDCY
jgi:hypothetical protein